MISTEQNKLNYGAFVIWFATIQISLIFLYHLSSVNFLKLLSNGMSLLLAVILLLIFFHTFIKKRIPIWCSSLLFILFVSTFFTLYLTSASDKAIMLKFFLFFLLGITPYILQQKAPRIKIWFIFYMLFMPILLSFLGGSRVYSAETASVAVSFFPNANTAVMYYVVLIGLASSLFKKQAYAYLLFFVNALFFQKLGAILATIVAIVITNFSLFKKHLIMVVVGVSIVLVLAFYSGAFDRLVKVSGDLWSLFSINTFQQIVDLSYGDLVEQLGTTDLSAIFRLKHWTEMAHIYTSQDIFVLLFGYGPGQTKLLTNALLPPHNDYMRILCEFGLLNFLLFIFYNLKLIQRIDNKTFKAAFLIILLYFFTENLIDNFISMFLLYSFAGFYLYENELKLKS
jgi:O-Antigen ligase